MKTLNRKQESGFTLLEVLVALVILAVGLLGLAGMQMSGLKNTNDSKYRTTAATLARDLADRMHANPKGMYVDNAYADVDGATIDCSATPVNCENGHQCSTAQIANYDVFKVYCGSDTGANKDSGLADLLPSGNVNIVCEDIDTTDGDPCSKFSPHKVTISWFEKGELSGRQKQYGSTKLAKAKTRNFVMLVSGRD